MSWRSLALAILAALVIAAPAAAAEVRPIWRQILVMWFPLLLIVGVWLFFLLRLQKTGFGKAQRAVIERSPSHMDAVEQKLDRIIELLERRDSR